VLHQDQKILFWFDAALFIMYGIEFMLKNPPPKPFWRGKSVQIIVRKPAEATLAGKNVHGNNKIPLQNHFGGESRQEIEPQTRQSDNHITKSQQNRATSFEAPRFVVY